MGVTDCVVDSVVDWVAVLPVVVESVNKENVIYRNVKLYLFALLGLQDAMESGVAQNPRSGSKMVVPGQVISYGTSSTHE